MRWKEMNEHEKIDVIGHLTITCACGSLLLLILFQIIRALLHG